MTKLEERIARLEEQDIDALRGGVRDAFPECLVSNRDLRAVLAARAF